MNLPLRTALLLLAPVAPIAAGPPDWPQWGGPNRDFTCPDVRLSGKWPESGPQLKWLRPLGEGYSDIVAADGRLYTMYRDGDHEVVVCMSTETGTDIWTHRYPAPIETADHPSGYGFGPRSTPAISGDRLYAVGFTGILHCLDRNNGDVIWKTDLLDRFNGNRCRWGYACSPLIQNGKLFLFVGGPGASVIALDPARGTVIWKRHNYENSYASPKVIEVAGRAQLVCFMAREVCGLEPTTGDLLWTYPHENQWRNNICDPVAGADGLLFTSSEGHGGSRVIRLPPSGGKAVPEQIWETRKIRISHRNAICVGDYIYCSSGDFGPAFMTAVNMRTGEIAWRERGFAEAALLCVGRHLLILDENGILALATATPKSLTVHSRTKVLDEPAWTIPTLIGNTVFLRDRKVAKALILPVD
mgnify:CR=1 FL=1